MPVPFHERVRFAWAPGPGGVEVHRPFAGQQRVVETPRRFGEVCADEKRLIADHHVAEKGLVGFGKLAERLFVVELQRPVGKRERPPRTDVAVDAPGPVGT